MISGNHLVMGAGVSGIGSSIRATSQHKSQDEVMNTEKISSVKWKILPSSDEAR